MTNAQAPMTNGKAKTQTSLVIGAWTLDIPTKSRPFTSISWLGILGT